jgi:hypothetical protein
MLARGHPFIVSAKNVAMFTSAYQADPEILLGCILVSGTLETSSWHQEVGSRYV